MLFECVTGQLPFDGLWLDVLTRKCERAAPRVSTLVSGVPEALEELVAQLLRRDVKERASAAHVLAWCEGRRRSRSSVRLAPRVAVPAIVLESRHAQLETLRRASERVRRLRPTAVFVRGASGVGKTVFVESVLGALERGPAPFVVLRGRCVEHETVLYRVFDRVIDDLARFLRGLPADERVVDVPVPNLLRLFPVLSRVPGLEAGSKESIEGSSTLAGDARRLAIEEFTRLLHEVAKRHFIAIHLDNVELGDRDSVALLTALLDGPGRPPLLLICSYRDDGGSCGEIVAAIRARLAAPQGGGVELALGELPRLDMIRLARRGLASSRFSGDSCAAAIADSCGGSPLLIEQLARLVTRYELRLEARVTREGASALSWRAVLEPMLEELPSTARAVFETIVVDRTPSSLALIMHAAAVPTRGHEELDALVRAQLVCSRERGEFVIVGVLHDRLRRAALALMSEARRRVLHRALASAHFEHKHGRSGKGARHLVELGERARAAEPFADAGYQALQALAFDRAVRMYTLALRCTPDDRGLRIHLAEALAFADRPSDAGRQFLRSARASQLARRISLTARGIEQLIYGGELEVAMKALRGLLVELGAVYPETHARASALLVLELERLTGHSLRFREHNPCELSSRLLAELDAYCRIGKALLPLDPARGGYLLVRGTLTGLLIGEPQRVAQGLALVGLLVTSESSRRALRFLDRAEALAVEISDRYARSLVSLARAALAHQEARWLDALGHYDAAERRLEAEPQTTAWDRAMISAGQRATSAAMGELSALHERGAGRPLMMTRYDRLRSAFGECMRLLAEDRPDEARAHVMALARIDPDDELTRALVFPLLTRCDLYTGQVREDWSAFLWMFTAHRDDARTGVRDYRVDLTLIRGALARSALARALTVQARREQLLEIVGAVIRAFTRDDSAAHKGEVALLQAGLFMLEGDKSAAVSGLRAAALHFLRAGMELHLASTLRCLGELLGDDEGAALSAQSELFFAREGVRDAARWTRMCAPTFLLRRSSAEVSRASPRARAARGVSGAVELQS
jgi:hypothetical protein